MPPSERSFLHTFKENSLTLAGRDLFQEIPIDSSDETERILKDLAPIKFDLQQDRRPLDRSTIHFQFRYVSFRSIRDSIHWSYLAHRSFSIEPFSVCIQWTPFGCDQSLDRSVQSPSPTRSIPVALSIPQTYRLGRGKGEDEIPAPTIEWPTAARSEKVC